MENTPKRINWIDWAKAFGIYLVVLGHAFAPKEGMELEVKNFIYAFHMPLFFFLSGFLFKVKEDNFLNFTKESAKSLIIPYVFLNVLSAIILFPSFIKADSSFLQQQFISFLTGEAHSPAGPAWFLLCLFFVRLFSYFIVKLNISIQVIFLVISAFIAYYIPIDIFYAFDSAFMALPIFMIGYYLKQANVLEKVNSISVEVILFVSLFIALYFINHIQGRVDINLRDFGHYPYLYYIGAFIGVFMLIFFSKLFNKYDFSIVRTISSGSIVIMGLHCATFLYTGTIIRKIAPGLSENQPLFNGILMSVLTMTALYYPIIFLQKYFSFFIGNRKIK